MSTIESLLNDLANLDAQADVEGVKKIRQQIVEQYPDSDEAAEAQYKLGLDFLFRGQDARAAMECFQAAIQKKHHYWSPQARISAALCLYHRGDGSKALFELRKVAYPEFPDAHSITALTFIGSILEETSSKEEVDRVHKDRLKQLKELVKDEELKEQPEILGFYLHQLGMAYLRAEENERAKKQFRRALELGEKAIGPELYETLKMLSE